MKIRRDLAQGSPAWLEWRRQGIGGSDLVGILGLQPPWKGDIPTRASVLAQKVDGVEGERNFAMRRGTRLEPVARAAYEERHRCTAPPACVEDEKSPWMRVSLDGLCRQRHFEGPPWVLELKCPGWESHSMTLAGVVPDYYRSQIQWQLLITGLELLHYASYSEHQRYAEEDRLATVIVTPDAAMQQMLLRECAEFWAEVEEARKKRAEAVRAYPEAGVECA